MKKTIMKVTTVGLLLVLVGCSEEKEVDESKISIDSNVFERKFTIGHSDYREIFKEELSEPVKSEREVTKEITEKAMQAHYDRIEAERINHEKFVKLLKKEKEVVTVSRGKSQNKSGYMTFEATYYSAFCNTCGGKGITASGVSVANSIYYKGYRVIATHQNEIPMWSIVEIKTHYGTFEAVALDRGGFKARGIDILVESDSVAYKLGRHKVQVKIIGKIK